LASACKPVIVAPSNDDLSARVKTTLRQWQTIFAVGMEDMADIQIAKTKILIAGGGSGMCPPGI
jgi:hypothetical protein